MLKINKLKHIFSDKKTSKIFIILALVATLPLIIFAVVKFTFDIRKRADTEKGEVGKVVKLNENNNGQTIYLVKGDIIELTLQTDTKSDYVWNLKNFNKAFLRLLKLTSDPDSINEEKNQTYYLCNQECNFMEPNGGCADGLFCQAGTDRSKGVCRHINCPNDKTCSCASVVTTGELEQGWYWGTTNQKKIGTPNNWIYKDAGKSSCWYKPGVECVSGSATVKIKKNVWSIATIKAGTTTLSLEHKAKSGKIDKRFKIILKIVNPAPIPQPTTITSCPDPRVPASGELCTQAIVWALNPNNKICCQYASSCYSPKGWKIYNDEASCKESIVKPPYQCNQECNFMEPNGGCADGLFCQAGTDRSKGICRNEKCPDDNKCLCLPPSPTFAQCNQPCNMSVHPARPCIDGLECYPLTRLLGADGVCRNYDCVNDTDCVCGTTPPTSNVIINLKIKLKGVTGNAAEGAKIKLRFRNDSKSVDLQTSEIVLTHESGGIYKASITLPSNQLPAANNYIIYVKGEKHLSNKYCTSSNQSTRCTDYQGSISIPSSGTVNLDFSKLELEPGDLQPQDGKADYNDFLKIKEIMNKTCDTQTENELLIGDLDYSKCVNVIDAFLMRKTLEVRYDEY